MCIMHRQRFFIHRANVHLDTLKRTQQSEVARLEALLRKSEMRLSSLEKTAEEKDRENKELARICDELIAKVGSN